jgi:16S rRNA (guanine527-N7)-methyltransferase
MDVMNHAASTGSVDGAASPAASDPTPESAAGVFGAGLPLAEAFVAALVRHGVERGLIGPRETDRLWDRHVLNSAVIGELIPAGATVVDVGSGAGFPGVPLAIARPDLRITLLEPMARRVGWLTEVVTDLKLPVTVVRGRAEEGDIRRQLGGADVVTARAVAPLGKLAGWCLPLLRPGGVLIALKGDRAAEELDRDAAEVRRLGGAELSVANCGAAVLAQPATVVVVRAEVGRAAGRQHSRGTRKDR